MEWGAGAEARDRRSPPAIFRRRRQPEPATFGDLLEGFLESLWRRDAAIVMAEAAFEIADAIERLQHFLSQLGGLAQDGFADIGGGVGKAGKILLAIDLEHVVPTK